MYTLLADYILHSNVNIIKIWSYITFRAAAGAGFAFALTVIMMPYFIRFISKKYNNGQPIRTNYIETHISKQRTPTMGGLVMLLASLLSIFLFSNITNPNIGLTIFTMLGFGAIGFIDDIVKISNKNVDGMKAKVKFICQCLVAVIVVFVANRIYINEFYTTHITLPFLKNVTIACGACYTLLRVFVIVGASNAVNLTDGLDGLAIVPVIFNLITFGILCYLSGNAQYAKYLLIYYQADLGELCILLASVIGASLGFLWYNIKPAQIFMGDTGSLFLGGLLGTIAVLSKNEILFAITGGLFVIETLSVMIQVAYFKKTGKRIFKMAPIHHHFEKSGWSEMQVVIRLWILSGLFCFIGLLSIKLR